VLGGVGCGEWREKSKGQRRQLSVSGAAAAGRRQLSSGSGQLMRTHFSAESSAAVAMGVAVRFSLLSRSVGRVKRSAAARENQ
jgi:hypothetical protein